ncbi:hypothetical protein GURASL_14780 [Geotalea uraniireducens]|uniref:Glycosyltransferase 2-like domain-containing protein n=1 Tax=Geotalea uraniireducens TaxID=351604 RepID=A0ABN6VWE9_9BACT|nr:glycosyltransferase [Geotalea uraniireducens]BDV42555.1 hypothetical protein GURASL_14780 [Geotalea uraniireducens]
MTHPILCALLRGAAPDRSAALCGRIAVLAAEAALPAHFLIRNDLADAVPAPAARTTVAATAGTAELLRTIGALYQQTPFRVVHVHNDDDLRLFLLWRLLTRQPFMIVRTWFPDDAVQPGRLNNLIYNRLTAVNLLLAGTSGDDGAVIALLDRFRLKNLFTVRDDRQLANGGAAMFEHCYRSMTQPSRQQAISGVKNDWSHIALTYITHYYLNQGSPNAVFNLLKRYEQCDRAVLDRLHFVIVDDGSPLQPEIPELNLNITWLRVNEDIRWNQSGARNLGAVYAKSDKILLTDLDHEFPEETLRAMIEAPECGRSIYKIYRIDQHSGKSRKGHANTFFLSRARFMRFWGYDEEFSGHYGAEDYRFVKFQKAHGCRQRYFNSRYRCHIRADIDRKREYHSLSRDLSCNTPVDARKKFELDTFGPAAGHSRTFLDFTWTTVREHRREISTEPAVNRGWKRRWLWRWLVGER